MNAYLGDQVAQLGGCPEDRSSPGIDGITDALGSAYGRASLGKRRLTVRTLSTAIDNRFAARWTARAKDVRSQTGLAVRLRSRYPHHASEYRRPALVEASTIRASRRSTLAPNQ